MKASPQLIFAKCFQLSITVMIFKIKIATNYVAKNPGSIFSILSKYFFLEKYYHIMSVSA